MTRCNNASLIFQKTLINLLAGFKVMLSGSVEDWNLNIVGCLEKYQINLDANILVDKDTGKRCALAWHHN